MASPAALPKLEHFNVHRPAPYVAHVEIHRPAKLNAFVRRYPGLCCTPDPGALSLTPGSMWLELRTIFKALSVDPAVRAVVLSGAGPRAFTTGLDVQAAATESAVFQPTAAASDGARHAALIRRHIAEFQDCVGAIERCEKPVLCVLHGFCLGLAIDIAACADVRLCAADAVLAVQEVEIGLAADIGTLSRLPKIVGNYGWVKDVCLTARRFGPQEAERVGFVQAVAPDKAKALEMAIEEATLIAGKSPVAVQGTKEILNWSRDHSVQDGLRYTGIWNGAALQAKDVKEAMTASISKRKPTFEKL